MSCCRGRNETKFYADCNDCVHHGDAHMRQGCTLDSPLCLCRGSGGCFLTTDCNTIRPVNTVAINSCLEPCQCAEEIEWNCYTPPKPGCKWLSNFCKLRRQWSNHARQQNCKCCNCRPRFDEMLALTRSASVCDIMRSASHIYIRACKNGWEEDNTFYSLISYLANIGYTSLVPDPLALLSFILLIFITIGLCCGLSMSQRSSYPKLCLRHSN